MVAMVGFYWRLIERDRRRDPALLVLQTWRSRVLSFLSRGTID